MDAEATVLKIDVFPTTIEELAKVKQEKPSEDIVEASSSKNSKKKKEIEVIDLDEFEFSTSDSTESTKAPKLGMSLVFLPPKLCIIIKF